MPDGLIEAVEVLGTGGFACRDRELETSHVILGIGLSKQLNWLKQIQLHKTV